MKLSTGVLRSTANCDALPRLPHEESKIGSKSEVYCISTSDKDFLVTAKDIGKAKLLDPVLSKVLDWVKMGSPKACAEDLELYYTCWHEFSCEQNCILWGSRVVILQVFREKMLRELHWEHPGICEAKEIACTCA